MHRSDSAVDDMHKLRLNSAKTELMVAVSPHHQRLVDEAKPVLRSRDSVTYSSASVRSLGVIFDFQMTMRPCVNSVIQSANAALTCDPLAESDGI